MKYPIHYQTDSRDCGPACLRMISSFYGKEYASGFVKKICCQKRTGTTLLDLSIAAENLGMRATGVKVSIEQLRNQVHLPCIISWNKNHYVVLYKISKSEVTVGDPAAGLLTYPIEIFERNWFCIEGNPPMGIALLLEPTPVFFKINDNSPKSAKATLIRMLSYVKPYRLHLCIVSLLFLAASILSFFSPILTEALVDFGIEQRNIHLVFFILLAELFLLLGQGATNMVQNWLLVHVSVRVNLALVSDFLSKLMRLPISFFDAKKTGDLIQRIGDFSRIQQFLTEVLISLVMAVIGFFAYSIVIAHYNWHILLLFVIGSCLYVLWILLFMNRRRKLDYMRFQASADHQSNIIQLITGMQEIKMNGAEKKKQWEWEQIQTRIYDVRIKSLNLLQIQQVGGMFIDQSKNLLIIFLSALSVIDGEMTIGMMLALQFMIGQLNAPISQFISFIQSLQDTRISIERLNEIQEMDDEDKELKGSENYAIQDGLPIHVDNVCFQYNGRKSRMVLDHVSVDIEANKVTAIVGASGSGKTTLMKLLLGFYQPTEGHISIGNTTIEKIPSSEWRKVCSAVLQDGFIFSDTIANNIAISDPVSCMDRVKWAAQNAMMDEYIEKLPMGYNTIVGMEGNGLSAGQKQRILIARAFYKGAPYIFLDEATNSLDANNEYSIMSNIMKNFSGRTVVVIAHRLSTIRNADKIIVMDNSRIVEQGTHLELIANQGYYYNLVNKQLSYERKISK